MYSNWMEFGRFFFLVRSFLANGRDNARHLISNARYRFVSFIRANAIRNGYFDKTVSGNRFMIVIIEKTRIGLFFSLAVFFVVFVAHWIFDITISNKVVIEYDISP